MKLTKKKGLKLGIAVYNDKFQDHLLCQTYIEGRLHIFFDFCQQSILLNNQINICQCLDLRISLVQKDKLLHITMLYYLTIELYHCRIKSGKIWFYYQNTFLLDIISSKSYLYLVNKQMFHLDILLRNSMLNYQHIQALNKNMYILKFSYL